MTSASTYKYGIDYNPVMGVVTRARTPKNTVQEFLSVDPLTGSYPWNSPYAFAEDSPIAHIDLDGLEKLQLTNISKASKLKPIGSAKITISMDYKLVTQGDFAVDQIRFDAARFERLYKEGNTVLYALNIPTKSEPANFLSGKNARLAKRAANGSTKALAKLNKRGVSQFYVLDVEYDYTVTVATDIADARAKQIQGGVQENGVILSGNLQNPATGDPEVDKIVSAATQTYNSNKKALEASTVGIDNFVTLRPQAAAPGAKPFPNEDNLTVTEAAVHGAGHNSATTATHKGNPDYQYSQPGLQSNTGGSVRPTNTNTQQIINDPINRQTLPK